MKRLIWMMPKWFHNLLWQLTDFVLVRTEDTETGECVRLHWEKR